jgi:hypothetical protein
MVWFVDQVVREDLLEAFRDDVDVGGKPFK